MTRMCFLFLLLGLILYSCDEAMEQTIENDFSGLLTREEIERGVLTPDVLWRFGRVGDMQLSPDGTTIAYNVSRYDVATNNSVTDIFRTGTRQTTAVALTNSDGKYIREGIAARC